MTKPSAGKIVDPAPGSFDGVPGSVVHVRAHRRRGMRVLLRRVARLVPFLLLGALTDALYSSHLLPLICVPSPDVATLSAACTPSQSHCSTSSIRTALLGTSTAALHTPPWHVDLDSAGCGGAAPPTASARVYASLGEWLQVVHVPTGGAGVRRAGTWAGVTLHVAAGSVVVTAPHLYDPTSTLFGAVVVGPAQSLYIPRFASYSVVPISSPPGGSAITFVEHLSGFVPFVALHRAIFALVSRGDVGSSVAVLGDYTALLLANARAVMEDVQLAGAFADARAALPGTPSVLWKIAAWPGSARTAAARVAQDAALRRERFTAVSAGPG
jgi:hypothetical protein